MYVWFIKAQLDLDVDSRLFLIGRFAVQPPRQRLIVVVAEVAARIKVRVLHQRCREVIFIVPGEGIDARRWRLQGGRAVALLSL